MYKNIMDGREEVRVAIVQKPPVYMCKKSTIQLACESIRESARNGAELIAFPEAWLAGYPLWTEGWDLRFDEWSEMREIFYDNSVPISDPELIPLQKTVKEHKCYVVVGFNERDERPGCGTVYNSILFIGRDGKIMGHHRKLVVTFAERTFWGSGDSSDLVVYDTDIGRISGLICAEHWMPLVKASIAMQGVDFHVAGWAAAFDYQGPGINEADVSGNGPIHVSGRQFALDAGCFVLNCAGLYDIDSVSAGFPYKNKLHFYGKGGSSIIGPSGQILVGPSYENGIIYFDCKAKNIKLSKAIVDTIGHYARPDVMRLQIFKSNSNSVIFEGDEEKTFVPRREVRTCESSENTSHIELREQKDN